MFLCSKIQDIVVKLMVESYVHANLMPSNQIRALASFLRLNPEIHLERVDCLWPRQSLSGYSYTGSFDERGNKVRQARNLELHPTAFALRERVGGRERLAFIHPEAFNVTIKQVMQKDDKIPRVWYRMSHEMH
jgi:hypothetical protein